MVPIMLSSANLTNDIYGKWMENGWTLPLRWTFREFTKESYMVVLTMAFFRMGFPWLFHGFPWFSMVFRMVFPWVFLLYDTEANFSEGLRRCEPPGCYQAWCPNERSPRNASAVCRSPRNPSPWNPCGCEQMASFWSMNRTYQKWWCSIAFNVN